MTLLAPKLFDRRYDDLLEIGRSQLPALAPEWTDYNAHDPGIMLMELLAWVTEAQLYSLGRTRRDERLAYGALLGVAARGTRPARGIIWRDRLDPASPLDTFDASRVIKADAAIRLEGTDAPVFYPERKTLWVPGRIVRLFSRLADGNTRDLTSSNDRGAPFLPFGDSAGPHDRLVIEYESKTGLFPARREDAVGACWVIGVRTAEAHQAQADEKTEESPRQQIEVSLLADGEVFPLPVLSDSTHGLMRTGALALDVSRVTTPSQRFSIEIRAPRGFPRPPRWARIEPNSLPITQRRSIVHEPHVAKGQPDFEFGLDVPGLCFDSAEQPVSVWVRDRGDFEEWMRRDRLSEHGPGDRIFELDAALETLRFGNGVNGRRPDTQALIEVSYAVSDGAAGNVASQRRWTVAGFSGPFGTNPDPITGGADAPDGDTLQREARHAKEAHALVNRTDIESAALAIPDLGVARAWIVAPSLARPRTGTLTLIAVRERSAVAETAQTPEPARWLEAVRRRLAARLPLGTRLVVQAPRYADFLIRATIEVQTGRCPSDIAAAVRRELEARLAIVKGNSTPEPRRPGVPLARRDVAAWILGVSGVARIVSLELVAGRRIVDEITVSRLGLPRLLGQGSKIDVVRAGVGSET